MKHLVSIILICYSLGGFSQTWAPFPLDETSEWRVENAWLTGEGCWVSQNYNYYVSGQQIHEGNEYHVISYTGTSWSQSTWNPESQQECNIWPPQPISGVRGMLRAEDGKIYEPTVIGEAVLYDFTLEVGDSVQGFGIHMKVDSIDQIEVNDYLCKRIWVSEYSQGWSGGPIWIIENVGHQHGLFEPMIQFENSSSLCYRENWTPVLSYEFGAGCLIIDVDESATKETQISPNPSTGIFRIESPQKSTYCIYDLFGRMVKEGQLDGASEIDLSSEPSGIYPLLLENEKGVSTAKLVKQ